MGSDGAFDLRPIEAGDVGNWSVLLAAIQAADQDWNYFTEQDLLEDFDDPHRDFARGSAAVYDHGTMVGYGALMTRSEATPVHDMRYQGGVHPAYRQRGIGGRLLEWAEAAALPMHQASHPGHPLTLYGSCIAGNAGAVALYAARGYTQARWTHAMVRDLTTPLSAIPAPAGVEITGWTTERSEDARLVRNDAFRDHWGSTPASAQGWGHFMTINSFRPAFSFLAYAAGELVGFIIAHEYDAYAGATEIKDIHIALLGTRRAGRKQGIGSALLFRVLTQAKAAGFTSASLGVDADSLTGALGLYERAGFTVEHTNITQAKELLPAN